MRHPTRVLAAFVAAVWLIAIAMPAGAVPVTYQTQVTISNINDPLNLLASTGLTPGSVISFSYTFESTTADAAADPTLGQYVPAIVSMDVAFPNGPFSLDASTATANSLFFVDGYDYSGTPIDGYAADVTVPGVDLAGTVLDSLRMDLYLGSTDTTILADDSIQITQPGNPPADFDAINQFQMLGVLGGSGFQVDGFASALLAVPEPSTGLLLGAGLVALGLRRRSRVRGSR